MRNALVAAAFLLSGCGLLTAEIDVERVDVTVPGNKFPSPLSASTTDYCNPSGLGNPPCVAATLDYDLGSYVPALTNSSVSYDLRLLDASITLSSTNTFVTDLSAIQSAVIRVLDAEPPPGWDGTTPLTGTVVASYTRANPIPSPFPESISVSGDSGLDLGPYLDTGKLPIRVEVVLDNSSVSDFWADVHAGFSLVMKVDWGSYVF